MIHNFIADGFEAPCPKDKGGRPKACTLPERREITKSKPAEHDLPFSTWSLVKLADFPVAEGVVDDISHEGPRILLREEGVTLQRVKTWKTSKDPDYEAKKARVEHVYALADIPEPGKPEVIFCMDEFGPLNLQPRPFCCYLRSLHPTEKRIAIVCDDYSPHLTTKRCRRVADRAETNNVEIAYTPTNSSWPNRIEAQFTPLRYFALDGIDRPTHKAQGSMIRRYIIWRNKHATDESLNDVVARVNAA